MQYICLKYSTSLISGKRSFTTVQPRRLNKTQTCQLYEPLRYIFLSLSSSRIIHIQLLCLVLSW